MASAAMGTTTTDQFTTSNQELRVQLNVDESNHNAVLWYQYELPGQGREAGKAIPKIKFLYLRTEPEMQSYCEQSPQLLTWVQEHQERQATQAVLYSEKGFVERGQIMRELKRKVESQSLTVCCLSCGCAVTCCYCCCGKPLESGAQNKLNEPYYCQELQKRHPTKSQVTAYTLMTTNIPPVDSKLVQIDTTTVFPPEPTPVEAEIILRE